MDKLIEWSPVMAALLERLKLLLHIADKEGDSEEQIRQHGFLIYMGLLMSLGGLLWGTLCMVAGLYQAAVVPYAYILLTTFNFIYLYDTKDFIRVQNNQILISLLLPFVFQFLLGGFVASGGNVLWSVLAVFGSFTLRRKHMAVVWLILFVLLVLLSGLIDPYARVFDTGITKDYVIAFFVLNFILVIVIIFSLYYYFVNSEEQARKKLQESLEKLNIAQEQLIESEKMASLGALVSGVAHEINTPLGVGMTGISQIDHEVWKLEHNYNEGTLTEEAFQSFIQTVQKLSKTIHDRLNNAVMLVRSFKAISVDQHFEDMREFNLRKYIDDLLLSMHNPLKSKQVEVMNMLDEDLLLESYPGIFSQIFSNFIMNSIVHGFEDHASWNLIKIRAERTEDKLILIYEDNGVGVSEAVEKKMLDPFFTTKRGQGGSGLGLNVVYNLITQKLGGTLEIVHIAPQGLGYRITLDKSVIKV